MIHTIVMHTVVSVAVFVLVGLIITRYGWLDEADSTKTALVGIAVSLLLVIGGQYADITSTPGAHSGQIVDKMRIQSKDHVSTACIVEKNGAMVLQGCKKETFVVEWVGVIEGHERNILLSRLASTSESVYDAPDPKAYEDLQVGTMLSQDSEWKPSLALTAMLALIGALFMGPVGAIFKYLRAARRRKEIIADIAAMNAKHRATNTQYRDF